MKSSREETQEPYLPESDDKETAISSRLIPA